MDLVPAYCRSCAQFFLESPVVVAADNVLCDCGGIARVLPGAQFPSSDESLFDAVVRSLSVAGVSWMTAPALARTLDGREAEAPGTALSRLVRVVPSLAIIELIAGGDDRRLATSELMLAVVLEGIAATRSRSDTAPRFVLEHSDASESSPARKRS
jgi:hypothetical protein